MQKTLVSLLLLVGISVITTSCEEGSTPSETKNFEESIPEDLDISTSDKVRYQRAKIAFFSLPSPMETARILKISGAIYDTKYLSPVEMRNTLETSRSKAIAMGMFISDLSYSNVFQQQQASMDYFVAINELATDLSLGDVFTQDLIERVDKNVSNEDSVLKYLTEVYWSTNIKLKEDDRESMAGLIAAGSWIEGLYIAVHLLDDTKEDDPMAERIAEQSSTLKQLIKFLSSFKDEKNLSEIIQDFESLEKLFDKIEVKTERVESKEEDGVAVVGKRKTYIVSEPLLKEIVDQTSTIRNKYIKGAQK
jgi:hypothetical protein